MENVLHHREATARTGMIFFLGSWWMMFAGLFFTFILLRARQTVWPPTGLGALSGLGLFVSTASMVISSVAIELGRRQSRRAHTVIASIFAVAFLVSQTAIAKSALAAGFTVSSPISGFVALIGLFHGLHALIGAIALLWLAGQATPRPLALRLWSQYWHFVGVIWILIYGLVVGA